MSLVVVLTDDGPTFYIMITCPCYEYPHTLHFFIVLYISLFLAALLKQEITVSFLWFSLPVHSGSLKRIEYSELNSLAHTLLLNVFSAFKGTHFYILFVVTAAGNVLCGSSKK